MCTYDAFCNNLRILKKRLQHFIIKQPTHFVIRGVVFYFPRENIQTFKKDNNGILLVVKISFLSSVEILYY